MKIKIPSVNRSLIQRLQDRRLYRARAWHDTTSPVTVLEFRKDGGDKLSCPDCGCPVLLKGKRGGGSVTLVCACQKRTYAARESDELVRGCEHGRLPWTA